MRPIDLLPDLKVRRKEQLISSLPRLLVSAVLIWMLLLGGLYTWVFLQKRATAAQLNDAQQQVQALEPVAQRVQQVGLLNGKVQELSLLLQTNTTESMVPILDLIASLMPSQVVAAQISINQNVVQISCTSGQLAAIGLFQHNLERTTSIQNVQLSMITGFASQQGTENVPVTVSGHAFNVTFEYKGGK